MSLVLSSYKEMNLTTLEKKGTKEMLKVLSAVSSSLLPNPNVGSSRISAENDEIIYQVINEIRQKLNISKDDYSTSAKSKIFDFLSKEISRIALTDENINKVRKRLGAKGELGFGDYKTTFNWAIFAAESLGERKSNIIEVIKHPDKVMHLNSKFAALDDDLRLGLTLLTKQVVPKKTNERFIQIVVMMRQADRLEILGNLRAYFSEIRLGDR